METGTGGGKLSSGRTTLTLSAATAGETTITIADTTPDDDRPGDAAPSITFTVYVVGDAATTGATGVVIGEDADDTDGIEYQVRGNQDSRIFVAVGDGSNLPVTITVNGGGRVYVEAAADRRTSGTTSLTTSSAALVYLSMNSRTNKVTASIAGLGSHTATYIYGNPSLEKISGTGQMGIAGGRT